MTTGEVSATKPKKFTGEGYPGQGCGSVVEHLPRVSLWFCPWARREWTPCGVEVGCLWSCTCLCSFGESCLCLDGFPFLSCLLQFSLWASTSCPYGAVLEPVSGSSSLVWVPCAVEASAMNCFSDPVYTLKKKIQRGKMTSCLI